MYLVNNLTKTPPQNLNLNTPIPSCIDSYVQIRAQYHKTYIGTLKYRLERISRYFSSYLIKDLTTSPYARDNFNSFITHRLSSVKPGTVRKAADEEGLHEFVLHSLRHYRLSKLIEAGHDSVLVSKVSGHRDHRVLSRYIKLDAEALASRLFD